MYNSERYSDPTADAVVKKEEKELKAKRHKRPKKEKIQAEGAGTTNDNSEKWSK